MSLLKRNAIRVHIRDIDTTPERLYKLQQACTQAPGELTHVSIAYAHRLCQCKDAEVDSVVRSIVDDAAKLSRRVVGARPNIYIAR